MPIADAFECYDPELRTRARRHPWWRCGGAVRRAEADRVVLTAITEARGHRVSRAAIGGLLADDRQGRSSVLWPAPSSTDSISCLAAAIGNDRGGIKYEYRCPSSGELVPGLAFVMVAWDARFGGSHSVHQ